MDQGNRKADKNLALMMVGHKVIGIKLPTRDQNTDPVAALIGEAACTWIIGFEVVALASISIGPNLIEWDPRIDTLALGLMEICS